MLNLAKYGFMMIARAPSTEGLKCPHEAAVDVFKVLKEWVHKFNLIDTGDLDVSVSYGSNSCSLRIEVEGNILVMGAYNAINHRAIKDELVDDYKNTKVMLSCQISPAVEKERHNVDDLKLRMQLTEAASPAQTLHAIDKWFKEHVVGIFAEIGDNHYVNAVVKHFRNLSNAS